MMDIQKLKHLASEADRQVTWSLVPFDLHKDEWETDVVNYIGAISPATITDLLNRLEKAEAQLAELSKQEAVSMRYRWCPPHMKEADGSAWIGEWKYCDVGMDNPRKDYERQELFTRAAPPAPLVDDVEAIIGLLEEREWAEHCTKTDLGKRLELLITELHDEAAGGSVADE